MKLLETYMKYENGKWLRTEHYRDEVNDKDYHMEVK